MKALVGGIDRRSPQLGAQVAALRARILDLEAALGAAQAENDVLREALVKALRRDLDAVDDLRVLTGS